MAFHEPQWYDRKAAINGATSYAGVQAPHGTTDRIEYTVPKDKIAMIEILEVEVMRVTAAGPQDIAWARWLIQPSGGAETVIMSLRLITNGVGDFKRVNIGTTMILLAGDKLIGKTSDTSTGGTCSYTFSYKVTEFDAYLYEAAPKTVPTTIEVPEDHPQEPGPRPDPRM